jgi:hypothetical protein
MKTISYKKKDSKKIESVKFDDWTYSKEGIILKYKNKLEIKISFADIDTIDIKKHTLHPLIKLICITSPFVLIFLSILYSPLYIVTAVAFFTIPPVFISVKNYKWHQLYVSLKKGTTYRKKISLNQKPEHVLIVEKVLARYMHYC